VAELRFRVYGLDARRVADAAIMAAMITGHVDGPSAMIGGEGSRYQSGGRPDPVTAGGGKGKETGHALGTLRT
jgi:hypothetical protein